MGEKTNESEDMALENTTPIVKNLFINRIKNKYKLDKMTENELSGLKDLKEIRKMGIEPYPYSFDRTNYIKEVIEK